MPKKEKLKEGKSMDIAALKADLERDEGRVPYAYTDSEGYWTCGVGFLIDRKKGGKIPDAVIDFWLDLLVNEVKAKLFALFPWFHTLNDARQNVIANMAYQLGIDGLLKFKRFLAACKEHDFETAADEILDSRAATQAPNRFKRHEAVMRAGQ